MTRTTPYSPLRSSSSSRATISLRQATALRMSLKPIFASSRKTCSTVSTPCAGHRCGSESARFWSLSVETRTQALSPMSSLILKRASASRPSGERNDDDFDVL